jgi:hypothetical protein
MSNAEPPGAPPSSTASWAVGVLRSLTVNNVLTMGILAAVGVPSYFAYRFMTDTAFRHEFMTTARIVGDAGVPCQVILGNLAGEHGGDRYSIFVEYDRHGPFTYLVSLRSFGIITQADIVEGCNITKAQAELMEWATEQKEELAREMTRGKAMHKEAPADGNKTP